MTTEIVEKVVVEKTETPKVPESFDKVMEKWDEQTRTLYDSHVAGLKSALKSERDESDAFAKQIKDLTKLAEKGSETEKALTDMTAKLEATQKRASFVEEANKPEIGCVNVKAAYALAVADDLFDKHGNPNWIELKKTAPELFRKAGKTDGGAGGETPKPNDINAMIRTATGR